MRGRASHSVGASLLALVALVTGGSAIAQEQPARIGPTPIRFYSGNLSVSEFMSYWGTAAPGARSGATAEQNALLKRCSVVSMCDYLTWALIEKDRGVWDWSSYDANQRTLAADGIGYNIFAWLHFPPKWFDDDPRFVRYVNLSDGKSAPQLSLWAPYTLELYDEFYRRLAAQFGDRIGFIRLAMPSEYGEIGYCTGMTNWLRPQPDAKPGYWCADAAAREDFRKAMPARYGTLAGLNRAWGTDYRAASEIAFPDVNAPLEPRRTAGSERTRWLDFADWYNQSWTDFMGRAVKIVRTHFPKKEIIISLGYGAEDLRYGNDQARHIAAMKALKVAAQTPGDVGHLATRRVSSACRAYGVPYYTEPPGDVPRDRQITRIWMDASNGTRTWFDYPQNLDRARDLFAQYKQHLTGDAPQAPIALWLPTLDHWLHPHVGWPAALSHLSDELRDLTDYEVVDDRMVTDGALQTLKTRMLVLAQPRLLRRAALQRALDWAEKGGVLVVFASDPVETEDGRLDLWERISNGRLPLADVEARPLQAGLNTGKGRIIVTEWDGGDGRREADVVAAICNAVSSQGRPELLLPDGKRDGVFTTTLRSEILMLNTTGTARRVTVHSRNGDVQIEMAGRTIGHVPRKEVSK